MTRRPAAGLGLASTAPALAAALLLLGSAPASAQLFIDAAAESGLRFTHFNGMSGEFYFPEMTGQGGALLDYDGDGDLDVYLVQGGMLGPDKTLEDALQPPPPEAPSGDRLFRNDSTSTGGHSANLRFVDVTEASGIRSEGYGMGVATGDADGDGEVDLYVTNFGANLLLHNNGDGTFTDATAAAGVDDPGWSTSASFFDLDADGLDDLYVANYVEFDLARNPRCFATSSRRDYCGPSGFPPQADRLFRNLGGGRFEPVTLRALPGYRPEPSLGVVAADLNGDDRLDLYVANDGAPNQLWINRGDGTFTERALLAGVAVNREGRAEASMGVDAGDFDGDGDEDLFLTHLSGETNTLFVNDGNGLFDDRSSESGLGPPSLRYTAFGTGWLDIDNDGWLDLLILNGAVRILDEQAAAGDRYPLRQTNQLFRNRGGVGFEELTDEAGEVFLIAEVSRGLAVGDVDNDGDADAVQSNNNGPARLLLNRLGGRPVWVGLRGSPASGGLRAVVQTAAGRRLWRRERRDGSYCSARDPRLLVGLGGSDEVAGLEAVWPDGKRLRWAGKLPTRRYLTLFRPD